MKKEQRQEKQDNGKIKLREKYEQKYVKLESRKTDNNRIKRKNMRRYKWGEKMKNVQKTKVYQEEKMKNERKRS